MPWGTFVLATISLFAIPRVEGGTKKSLVIGVDGLSPYGMVTSSTPALDRLTDGQFGGPEYGTGYTPFAFAGGVLGTPTQQVTSSGPGWSTVLTGVWTDQHGVTNNSFSGADYENNPAYLEILEESFSDFYSASVARWTPIDTQIISTVDDADSMVDFRRSPSSDFDVAATSEAVLALTPAARPSALFVHFDDVDIAGHGTGLFSNNYQAVVETTDGYIGRLLDAIEARPTFADEDWQVIITADHGHRPGGGHGGQTALERSIPFILAEKQEATGWLLNDTNPPSMADVVASVTDHFELPRPSHLAGVSRSQLAGQVDARSLQSGLVSHLPFDGAAVAGLAGNDGMVSGVVNYFPGRFGDAVGVANYSDGFVTLGDDLAAQYGTDGDFSMSLWVKQEQFTSDPAFFSNKNWDSGQNTGINLALNPDATLDFNTKAAAGDRADLHPFEALTAGAWTHVAFTVDRDGPTTLFINGALAGQIEQTSIGSFGGLGNWVLLNDGTGSYGQGSAVTGLQLDEFAAWDRLLSLDEILHLSQHALNLPIDFDGDGLVGCADIDQLVQALATGDADSQFDLNQDGQVTEGDLEAWLLQAGSWNLGEGHRYLEGDANLDGVVDGQDFVIWNGSKFTPTAAWCAGDFTADGLVDGQDFVAWNNNKFTSSLPVPEVAPLPGLLGPVLLCLWRRRKA